MSSCSLSDPEQPHAPLEQLVRQLAFVAHGLPSVPGRQVPEALSQYVPPVQSDCAVHEAPGATHSFEYGWQI